MAIPFSSQHTNTFPALLRQLGCSLLVSTYQAGQVVIVREQGGTLNTHFIATERPMGITAAPGRIAIANAFQVWEYWNLPAVAPKVEPVDTHDACYLPRSIHVTGAIDCHEIAYDNDEALWVVNTRMSCLCTLDRAYSVVPRWRPSFVSGYDLTDRCHLNGLAMRNGAPAYVTALGETDTAGGWRDNKASGGLLMTVGPERIIARGLSMPHSPRWHRDRLWFLESGHGSLATLDPRTGRKEVIAELPGFTRGLDFAGRYAFVGLSMVRETAVFAGLPLTRRVAERRCGAWVVDTEARQVVAFLTFTGDVREVFAVQLLPSRYPALLEIAHPLVRSSYALPDAALTEVAGPDPVQVRLEQAIAAHARGDLDTSIAGLSQLLEERPDHPEARLALGLALADAERWDDATGGLEVALTDRPNEPRALNALGRCRAALGDAERALEAFDRAIAADREFALAHYNRALLLLGQGRLKEGWAEYEWRWQLPSFRPFAAAQPRWHGEAIADKTLLVHTEQGAADIVQFARFLPLAAARCRRLMLVCPEPLRALLATVEGVAEVRVPGHLPADSFDLYCPLMSLPGLLGIDTVAQIPAKVPYLRVPQHVDVPALAAPPGALRIGLAWSETRNDNGGGQSVRDLLGGLWPMGGAGFFSLQASLSAGERAWLGRQEITDLEPELTDHGRMAAMIAQTDLVIATDSDAAHLAGALGRPVWILLTERPQWRWLGASPATCWYPTARFWDGEQLQDRDNRLREALAQWLEQRRTPA